MLTDVTWTRRRLKKKLAGLFVILEFKSDYEKK